MMTEPTERTKPAFAQANGMRLCYETFGRPSDPPLVLIMGLAAQMILWDEEFCKQLAAPGRWVIRFDNRDIGLSTRLDGEKTPGMSQIFLTRMVGRTPRAPYTLLDMAKDTIGLLDALGIERADVVGASMGGAIGQELAIHFPERLHTLTAIMATSGDPKLPPPTPAAMSVLMRSSPPEREKYVKEYVSRWRVLAANHFPFDEERTREQGETGFSRGINPPGVARQMLAIIASGNRKQALRTVSVPTAVIHGSADPLVPVAAGYDLAKAIPGATLTVIEGMGHSLPRGAWPAMLAAIDQIIASAR